MEKVQARSFGINVFTLKWIAIITMVVDHVGMLFFPDHPWPRCVGRLAFPIFCFLLVEGFYHTRNVRKYALRLGLFALISEVPFNLVISGKPLYLGAQNIFFTLLFGLMMMFFMDRESVPWKKMLYAAVFSLAAQVLHLDYGAAGVVMILCFYYLRGDFPVMAGFVAVLNVLNGSIQAFGALSLIPVYFYNGEKGPSMKYFFYAFYPLHLLILYGILQYLT